MVVVDSGRVSGVKASDDETPLDAAIAASRSDWPPGNGKKGGRHFCAATAAWRPAAPKLTLVVSIGVAQKLVDFGLTLIVTKMVALYTPFSGGEHDLL